jgi:hypothetical protein
MKTKENGGKFQLKALTVYGIKSVLSAQKHVHDTVNSVFAIIGCDCSFHIKS